jgi:hypothetical protein
VSFIRIYTDEETNFAMTKFLDPLIQDVVEKLKSAEVQASLESHILRPMISRVLSILYPYLFGIMLLWLMMFVCLAMILLILIRGSLADVLMLRK